MRSNSGILMAYNGLQWDLRENLNTPNILDFPSPISGIWTGVYHIYIYV